MILNKGATCFLQVLVTSQPNNIMSLNHTVQCSHWWYLHLLQLVFKLSAALLVRPAGSPCVLITCFWCRRCHTPLLTFQHFSFTLMSFHYVNTESKQNAGWTHFYGTDEFIARLFAFKIFGRSSVGKVTWSLQRHFCTRTHWSELCLFSLLNRW